MRIPTLIVDDEPLARRGIALAGQFQDKSERFLLTVLYTDSKYHNAWLERASHAILDGNAYGTPAFNPRSSTILGAADGWKLRTRARLSGVSR